MSVIPLAGADPASQAMQVPDWSVAGSYPTHDPSERQVLEDAITASMDGATNAPTLVPAGQYEQSDWPAAADHDPYRPHGEQVPRLPPPAVPAAQIVHTPSADPEWPSSHSVHADIPAERELARRAVQAGFARRPVLARGALDARAPFIELATEIAGCQGAAVIRGHHARRSIPAHRRRDEAEREVDENSGLHHAYFS